MAKIDRILNRLRESYLSDDLPWIVGFSGGKDSTMLVQLIYNMLMDINSNKRKKQIYILASDTRVEIPIIKDRIRNELELIKISAERDKLPIKPHIVYPKLNDTFWVNVIGRGYPSPSIHFRWCTDRLKIKPVSNYIKNIIDASGSVIVVLGVRKSESNIRARKMRVSEIVNQKYRPHRDLQKAWVYTPIEELTSDDVWTYLIDEASPWNGDNWNLVKLYKQAAGGECPLVIDTSTPPCGHNRFGCWVCTVVKNDRSMQSLVEFGNSYLEPLWSLRNYLKEIRDLPGHRQDTRRNGRPAYNREGMPMKGTGPFTHETRKKLLVKLLESQRKAGHILIEGDELAIIQAIWSSEEKKRLPIDSVQNIWEYVYKEESMRGEVDGTEIYLNQEDFLLKQVCEDHAISFEMMRRLRNIEEEYGHLRRRHGLPDEMREIVRQEARKQSEER